MAIIQCKPIKVNLGCELDPPHHCFLEHCKLAFYLIYYIYYTKYTLNTKQLPDEGKLGMSDEVIEH